MQRALVQLTTALVVVAIGPAAQAEPLPPGKVGALFAMRNGVGPTDGQIGFGWAFGVDAAWQPMDFEQRIGWGLNWSLLWAYFGEEAGARVTNTLSLLELDMGARLRFAPRLGRPQYLTLGGGAGLMRSNAPLPPNDTRAAFGGYATIGFEQGVLGALLLSAEVRYGLIGGEPVLLTGIIGVGVSL